MEKELASATSEEQQSIADFDALMSAKAKEITALTSSIESKTSKIGELGVELVSLKEDLDDTTKSLMEDEKFLGDMEKECKTKDEEWATRQKIRAEELLAIADTIKILNDDDALDLFKKTLPTPSLIQLTASSQSLKARALTVLRKNSGDFRLNLIALALKGKKVSFDKVLAMIDDMVKLLKSEQVADDEKKAYCEKLIDETEDKVKELELAVSDLEKAVADEIKALEDGIVALDKQVAEATAQRKEEHADSVETVTNDNAAKELIGFAKNRLNKFYNPKLYKAPAKRELTEEEQATLAAGGTLAPTEAPGGIAGTGITVLQTATAPPPPPEAFEAYSKKSEESNGIIAMMDLLIKDLDKEMTEAEVTEKDAQGDYEQMMKDSADKRAEDSKTLADKEGALAELKAGLEQQKSDLASTQKELGATNQYIHTLHLECDWLLKYFDMRKEARSNEIDALGKAKAVLSGADYSLVQMHSVKALRGR